MLQTTHYDLSQWEKTDRILREDFNADNAKLDAALHAQAGALAAESAARTAAVSMEAAAREALAGRVGTTRLYTLETTEAAGAVDIILPDILWEDYLMIYAIFTPAASTGAFTLYADPSNNHLLGGAQYFPAPLLLFPLGNRDLRLSGILFSDLHPVPFMLSKRFSEFTGMRIANNSSDGVPAGSKMSFWGVKG